MITLQKALKKNNFSFYIFLLLIFSFFNLSSCKKKQATIYIEGIVTNSVTSFGTSNIEVKIYSKEIENNTFSNGFKLLQKNTTDINGFYSFQFEYRNALEYKIEIQNTDYFNYTSIINPDDLKANEKNELPLILNPRTILKIRIKNQIPQNQQDNIVINGNNNSCNLCFTTSLLSLNGTSIDTTIIASTLGQCFWSYSYYVTKNNFTQSYNDSIYCEPGDTSFVNIFY
jgi:hypothetical protein